MLKGRIIKNPDVMMAVIEVSGVNREMKPFPPTVKVVQAKALARTRRSPKVEAKRNSERGKTPFEMMRKIPKKPKKIPK
jgi:hypothetical protein